ncbi:hypothetical protein E2562_022076, partial [Oryza meyeriana var. granulata]
MRKVVFHKLCAELRLRGLLMDTYHVTIEEQLAMFIHADRARRLLSKPIKFFNEMQELFTGSSAD